MPTTNSHIQVDVNSPMLRQGIVPNAKRGHYGGGGEGRRRGPRRDVEEDKKGGGVRQYASHGIFGDKH